MRKVIGLTPISHVRTCARSKQVRAGRQALLEDTEQKGFSTGYSGWRMSLKGQRFCIHDAVRAGTWPCLIYTMPSLLHHAGTICWAQSHMQQLQHHAFAMLAGAVEHRLAG